MDMTRRNAAVVASLMSLLIFATSCSLPAPSTDMKRYAIRGNYILADSYETEVGSVTSDTDYSGFEVGFIQNMHDSMGERYATGDFLVGFTEHGELDALELTGGGRYFIYKSEQFRPFLSLHTVYTVFDEVAGSEAWAFSVRAGAGLEYPIGEQMFADLGLDYSIPIFGDSTGSILGSATDVEPQGFAIRLGFGIEF